MTVSPYEIPQEDSSPIEMIAEMAQSKGWKVVRAEADYLVLSVKGIKTDLEMCLEWQEEFSALLMGCSIPVEIRDEHYETAAQTLEQINDSLWMGHFDLSNKGLFPTFRHTLLCRMVPFAVVLDLAADAIDIAVAECNRFHTTFQLLQAGDVQLQDNITAMVFETVGEA
jgi:hypothetical protein